MVVVYVPVSIVQWPWPVTLCIFLNCNLYIVYTLWMCILAWDDVPLLVHTHDGKLLSTLLFLFSLSSPLSVELVVAGSGAQELAVFSRVPRDLSLCCSVSLQWTRVEQVGPSRSQHPYFEAVGILSWYYAIRHWYRGLMFLTVSERVRNHPGSSCDSNPRPSEF